MIAYFPSIVRKWVVRNQHVLLASCSFSFGSRYINMWENSNCSIISLQSLFLRTYRNCIKRCYVHYVLGNLNTVSLTSRQSWKIRMITLSLQIRKLRSREVETKKMLTSTFLGMSQETDGLSWLFCVPKEFGARAPNYVHIIKLIEIVFNNPFHFLLSAHFPRGQQSPHG